MPKASLIFSPFNGIFFSMVSQNSTPLLCLDFYLFSLTLLGTEWALWPDGWGFSSVQNSAVLNLWMPSSIQFILFTFSEKKKIICVRSSSNILHIYCLVFNHFHLFILLLCFKIDPHNLGIHLMIQFSTKSISVFTASKVIFNSANCMFWFSVSLNPFLSTTRFYLKFIFFLVVNLSK